MRDILGTELYKGLLRNRYGIKRMYAMNTQTLRLEGNCLFYSLRAILESRMEAGPKTEKAVDQVDASCVRKIQAGRSDLIELLVRKHSDRLYYIILQMVQSPAAAEDLLQDTWVRVIRNLHKFDPDYPLTPWLTQIAVNACRSFWRRERLRGLLGLRKIRSWQSEPESDVPRELEAKKLAQKALQSLSPLLREIVVLKFYSGLTYEEIAETLKIPAGTAKSRLNYALMKMRDHMGQEKT